MSTHAETATTPVMDVVKQVASLFLVISGIAAFYYFSELALLYRVLGILVVVVAAMLLMLTTETGQNFWAFLQESRQEVRKVVWPSRQETMQTTLMVFAMVFIVGLGLWLVDMFLFWAIRMLTGQGG